MIYSGSNSQYRCLIMTCKTEHVFIYLMKIVIICKAKANELAPFKNTMEITSSSFCSAGIVIVFSFIIRNSRTYADHSCLISSLNQMLQMSFLTPTLTRMISTALFMPTVPSLKYYYYNR